MLRQAFLLPATSSIDVAVTEHGFSQMVCRAFAQGCGGRLVPPNQAGKRVACYGILRGCGEAMRRADEYWYIDHGFFDRSNPALGDGHYRVLRNRMWPASVSDNDWTRFDALGIRLKPWRESGDCVVVVPPTPAMSRFLATEGWLDRVLDELDEHTDRPVLVSEKGGTPARQMFENAWCIVTEHSQVAIDALIEGIPAIMLSPERSLGSIAEVENPPRTRDFFSTLANTQFTLDEMRSGECWARVKEQSWSTPSLISSDTMPAK